MEGRVQRLQIYVSSRSPGGVRYSSYDCFLNFSCLKCEVEALMRVYRQSAFSNGATAKRKNGTTRHDRSSSVAFGGGEGEGEGEAGEAFSTITCRDSTLLR